MGGGLFKFREWIFGERLMDSLATFRTKRDKQMHTIDRIDVTQRVNGKERVGRDSRGDLVLDQGEARRGRRSKQRAAISHTQ